MSSEVPSPCKRRGEVPFPSASKGRKEVHFLTFGGLGLKAVLRSFCFHARNPQIDLQIVPSAHFNQQKILDVFCVLRFQNLQISPVRRAFCKSVCEFRKLKQTGRETVFNPNLLEGGIGQSPFVSRGEGGKRTFPGSSSGERGRRRLGPLILQGREGRDLPYPVQGRVQGRDVLAIVVLRILRADMRKLLQ